MPAQRARLPDGRWHFQHGPIDLVIGAEGAPQAVQAAHESAWRRFETVLDELVAELALLRAPLREHAPCPLQGVVARRMWRACAPFAAGFITPMAAVAGAVAQELIASYERAGVARAWVNNGGDIALHLAPGASVMVGLFADLAALDARALADLPLDADMHIAAALPVRGIATSGWRGRSFSLGIADSVTVLARTAAQADAAATVIANAVNLENDARIERCPANQLKDDTDLGALEVTANVPALDVVSVQRALDAGRQRAIELQRAGLIHSALLVCQRRFARVEPVETSMTPSPQPMPPRTGERVEYMLPRPLAGEGWGEGARMTPMHRAEACRWSASSMAALHDQPSVLARSPR